MSENYTPEELNKESQNLIRFLLKDNAFDTEFLLTTIQDYYHENRDDKEVLNN